jgi:hypothetical protein
MVAQTKLEGRFLGGRPPYGYTFKDLGPHPNPQKAADGRKLHGLTPDPVTAPVVQRIFADFLNGNGIYAIAESLTAEGILCPSAYDRKRNPHRHGLAWAKGAVRLILTNPRYTGRQVWNKQRTDEVLLDVNDVAQGYNQVGCWNRKEDWIISKEIVHEPLVSEDVFEAAQVMLDHRARHGHTRMIKPTKYPYVFKSLLYCAMCGRRMQGLYAHDTIYYRCKYPAEYALANRVDHPKNVIMREDALVGPIDSWLAKSFSKPQRDQTIESLASQLVDRTIPVPIKQHSTKTFDAKMARYKAALDAGADLAVITGWMAEAKQEFDQALRIASAVHKAPRVRIHDHDSRRHQGHNHQPGRHRRSHPRSRARTQSHRLPKPRPETDLRARNTNGARRDRSWRTPLEFGSCPRGDLSPHA